MHRLQSFSVYQTNMGKNYESDDSIIDSCNSNNFNMENGEVIPIIITTITVVITEKVPRVTI